MGKPKPRAREDNSTQPPRRECLRQIVQMRRTQGSEANWSTLLGEAARSLGVRPAAPPLPTLGDPALYLDFFGQTLEYAAFPHKSKRHMASGSDIGAKDPDWKRMCEQIAESAIHSGWIYRDLVDHLGVLFADLFRTNGDCRFPSCIGPAVAAQLFTCRSAIADLRIQKTVGPWPRLIWSCRSISGLFPEMYIANESVDLGNVPRRNGLGYDP